MGFQIITSTKTMAPPPVTANQPSARGLAAVVWSILLHAPRREVGSDVGTAGTWVRDLAEEMEKTARRAGAWDKACRREGERMKSKKQCRRGPRRGSRWRGAQSISLSCPGKCRTESGSAARGRRH